MELEKMSVGDVVAEDHRAASVFKAMGVDFCCGGGQKMTEAVELAGISLDEFAKRLAAQQRSSEPNQNFKEWDLDLLCDYIVKKHHRYVAKTLPDLLFYVNKIAHVHGGRHPELLEIAQLFRLVNDELLPHMKNEEESLFPAITALLEGDSSAKEIIARDVAQMIPEHESAGGAMDQIQKLSNGYEVPADGCTTYRIAYKLLEEFEDYLHLHVHLENNILYPRALAL